MTSTFWKYHQLNSRGPQNSLKFESEITNLLVSQNKEFPEWWTVWVALSARVWFLWVLSAFAPSGGGGFEFSTISTRSESVFKALGIHGIIAKYQEETLFLSKYNENHTDMLKFAEKNVNYLLDHLIIFQNIGTIPIFQYSSTDYEFKY